MSKPSSNTITYDELTKMKMRANLIPSGNSFFYQGDNSENKTKLLYNASL
jgi:hypothetical protein